MARIENHKYSIEEAFRECFYIVPDYLTRSLVDLTNVGQNTSITRINGKLQSFPTWNAASIDKRHGVLMSLAQDVWKTTPIDV